MKQSSATMATNSERQIGETLTDSLLIDVLTPGYLPDVSAAHQGKYLWYYFKRHSITLDLWICTGGQNFKAVF